MPALTESARRDFIIGNYRAVKGEFSSVSDNDTWDPGLAIVKWVSVANRTANPTGNAVHVQISNGTAGGANQARITFDTQANGQSLVVVAVGN